MEVVWFGVNPLFEGGLPSKPFLEFFDWHPNVFAQPNNRQPILPS
jgi:hypothetical protein